MEWGWRSKEEQRQENAAFYLKFFHGFDLLPFVCSRKNKDVTFKLANGESPTRAESLFRGRGAALSLFPPFANSIKRFLSKTGLIFFSVYTR